MDVRRTDPQRKSSHLWYKYVADTFNEHGIDMQVFLSKRASIVWTGEAVKECIFKVLAKAMFNVDSSAKLTKKQHSAVVEAMRDFIARDYGLNIEYPSQETLQEQTERRWRK
jgi:hypothetical protein